MSDRRFRDRSESDEAMLLEIPNEAMGSFRLECTLVNYSGGGVGVKTELPVPVFAQVRVIAGPNQYEGQVRYCEKNPFGGYLVGIKFVSADGGQDGA
jgi:hypothetical protein